MIPDKQTNKHRTLDIYISIIKLIIHNLNTAGINKLTQRPQVHITAYLSLTPWVLKFSINFLQNLKQPNPNIVFSNITFLFSKFKNNLTPLPQILKFSSTNYMFLFTKFDTLSRNLFTIGHPPSPYLNNDWSVQVYNIITMYYGITCTITTNNYLSRYTYIVSVIIIVRIYHIKLSLIISNQVRVFISHTKNSFTTNIEKKINILPITSAVP